jgi:hypothetical protein
MTQVPVLSTVESTYRETDGVKKSFTRVHRIAPGFFVGKI